MTASMAYLGAIVADGCDWGQAMTAAPAYRELPACRQQSKGSGSQQGSKKPQSPCQTGFRRPGGKARWPRRCSSGCCSMMTGWSLHVWRMWCSCMAGRRRPASSATPRWGLQAAGSQPSMLRCAAAMLCLAAHKPVACATFCNTDSCTSDAQL